MAQKVLITAAASGIGLEIARTFSKTGAAVFITDINQQAIDAAKMDIPGLLATLCNNGKRSDIERMVPEAIAALGGLDVLVNNAGISGPTAPVEEMDPDKWEEVMTIDLVGTFNVTRLAIPHLKVLGGQHHYDVLAGRPVWLSYPEASLPKSTSW